MMESQYCARHVCPGGVNISERHARYRSMRASEGTEVVLRSFGDSDVDISGAVCAGRHDFVLGGGLERHVTARNPVMRDYFPVHMKRRGIALIGGKHLHL